jgi:hypothetical protein
MKMYKAEVLRKHKLLIKNKLNRKHTELATLTDFKIYLYTPRLVISNEVTKLHVIIYAFKLNQTPK